MKTRLNKGFTLIELLVVIAIIGILSGIVLTSLNSARSKAKDASAQASMSGMRAQAELGYSTTYAINLCVADATTQGSLSTLITAANAQVPAANAIRCGSDAAAGVGPTAWGAEITLNDGTFYCVDSTGFSGKSTTATDIAADVGSADVKCDNT